MTDTPRSASELWEYARKKLTGIPLVANMRTEEAVRAEIREALDTAPDARDAHIEGYGTIRSNDPAPEASARLNKLESQVDALSDDMVTAATRITELRNAISPTPDPERSDRQRMAIEPPSRRLLHRWHVALMLTAAAALSCHLYWRDR